MKIFNTQKNNSSQNGFTIIETLVAISILLVSTTGPLTFAQSGLRASFLARDQITAFYLAQDVIETIKHVRDNTGLASGSSWLENLGDCRPGTVNNTVVCNMDTAQDSNIDTVSCFGNECSPMTYNSTDKKYDLSGSGATTQNSKYTRTVFITELEANREAQIVVEVQWESNFFSEKRIIVQENIYNWVPKYAD